MCRNSRDHLFNGSKRTVLIAILKCLGKKSNVAIKMLIVKNSLTILEFQVTCVLLRVSEASNNGLYI